MADVLHLAAFTNRPEGGNPAGVVLDAPNLGAVLGAFGLHEDDLDTALPPRVAYAGARHLILGLGERARNAFAAAAALGAYLRELGLVTPPAEVTIHQGDDMGRPSLLTVGIDTDPRSGIRVSGGAVAIAP